MFRKHIKTIYFRTPAWVRERLVALQPHSRIRHVKNRLSELRFFKKDRQNGV